MIGIKWDGRQFDFKQFVGLRKAEINSKWLQFNRGLPEKHFWKQGSVIKILENWKEKYFGKNMQVEVTVFKQNFQQRVIE